MSKVSFYPRTKVLLETAGYVVEKTEHWNSFSHHRVDLLGVADMIALNGDKLLLVQITDHTNASSHHRKIIQSEKLKLWLQAGGQFVMYLWKKTGNRWTYKTKVYILAGNAIGVDKTKSV